MGILIYDKDHHYNLEAIISRINCGYVLLSCCLVNTILIIMFGAIEPIVFNMYGFSSKAIPVHIIKAISGIMFWLTICRMIPKNVKAAKPIEYFFKSYIFNHDASRNCRNLFQRNCDTFVQKI